jgi:hypothetical protein
MNKINSENHLELFARILNNIAISNLKGELLSLE